MVQTVGPIVFHLLNQIMTWKKMSIIMFNFIQYSNYIFIADRIFHFNFALLNAIVLLLLNCWYLVLPPTALD